jgi:hypothetical protein
VRGHTVSSTTEALHLVPDPQRTVILVRPHAVLGVSSRPPLAPDSQGKRTNNTGRTLILEALGFIAQKQLKVDSSGKCALA